jgi:outer membrane receptor protein involved in Fe transport
LQGGLRTEYTYRSIEVVNQSTLSGQYFTIDRWDFFPSVHSSYKFESGEQLMASYTRRIERPRGWALEPFETWMDANNVRRGNPALDPEFIDSYELGGQTILGSISMSAELYYRVTNNKIEDVRSIYSVEDDVILTTFENVGKDFSLGTELMFIFDPFEFWNVNLMGNLYNYKVEGTLYDQSFSEESFNWNTRFNNVFKISKATQLQLNVMYNSPSVSAQGSTEGFATADIAVKQDFFERLLSLTLQVRNILGTAKREFTSEGFDFYKYHYMERESPIVMLNLRLNFNTSKSDRDRERRGEDSDNGFEGGEDY